MIFSERATERESQLLDDTRSLLTDKVDDDDDDDDDELLLWYR